MFCFIIFVSFWFPFDFWHFVLCFCFKGDKKLSEDVGLNSNIKNSSVKDGVDGDEVLKDSFFLILVLLGSMYLILLLFGLLLVSDLVLKV